MEEIFVMNNMIFTRSLLSNNNVYAGEGIKLYMHPTILFINT